MIENDRQLEITRRAIANLERALQADADSPEESTVLIQAMRDGTESMIISLREQVTEYLEQQETDHGEN